MVIFLKTILITGATGGIGKELSLIYASHEYSLILVGRNKEKLENLKKIVLKKYNVCVNLILMDLCNPNAAKDIYKELKNRRLQVDILCNNAGLGFYGDFLDQKLEEYEELVQVNLNALVELCYYIGKDMKAKGQGEIINISSISAFFPGPYMATYYASKAFILSFSIALAKEAKPYGIRVLVACPGVIPTDFYKKAGADLKNSYLLERMPLTSPYVLAKKIYKSAYKNKRIIKNGILNQIYIFLSRFLPFKLKAVIVAWVQRKK